MDPELRDTAAKRIQRLAYGQDPPWKISPQENLPDFPAVNCVSHKLPHPLNHGNQFCSETAAFAGRDDPGGACAAGLVVDAVGGNDGPPARHPDGLTVAAEAARRVVTPYKMKDFIKK